jgi:hypothetical protein
VNQKRTQIVDVSIQARKENLKSKAPPASRHREEALVCFACLARAQVDKVECARRHSACFHGRRQGVERLHGVMNNVSTRQVAEVSSP